MWPASPSIDFLILWLLKQVGCRIVYSAHNPIQHDHKKRNVQEMTRIYHQVDHVIALTNYTRQEIIKLAGIPYEDISVITHGDFGYVFSQSSINKSLAEDIRRKAKGRKILTFLGIIRPYKGLEYFIKAFPLIKHALTDVFFLVAGSTRFANQQQLKMLIAENCAPEECHVDMRYLPIEDMKAYLSVTDILVQPYINASQSGNTVMAYSEGIPVISTNVGGLSEMVEDGQTGYIIPPKDSQAIAGAAKKCFENDNWTKLSENAAKVAAEKYSWETITAQTLAVYQNVLGR
jgi:glycosyltransferase involved in cell wall biosynthesis